MNCLKAFVRSKVTDSGVVTHLKQKYNAKVKLIFRNRDECRDLESVRYSVRIDDIAFNLDITMYTSAAASETASKEIYIGTSKVLDTDSLTQLTFKYFSQVPDDQFVVIATKVVGYFGGGYLTSDVYSKCLRTYAVIESLADADNESVGHSNVFC